MRIFSGHDKTLFCIFAVAVVLFGFAVYLSKQGFEDGGNAIQEHAQADYTVKIEKEKSFSASLDSDPVAYFTKWLFIATGALTIFTAGLAIVTILIWIDGKETSSRQHIASRRTLIHTAKNARAAEIAANAAQNSAEILRRTLIANNRAWLRAELTVPEQNHFLSRLTSFDKEMAVPFRITIENVGNAVAQKVTYDAWFSFERNVALREAAHASKCQEVRENRPDYAFTVFPGESLPASENEEHIVMAYCDKAEFNLKSQAVNDSVFIYGCVSYCIPADPKSIRQSRFCYMLTTDFPNEEDALTSRFARLRKIQSAESWHAD